LKALIKFKALSLFNLVKANPLFTFLLVAILLTTGAKFGLVGKGFLAFPDEFRYSQSVRAVVNALKLDITSAFHALFSTQGRPADTLIKTIPASIQLLIEKVWGLELYESRNSYPLFVFNFIVYILLIWVHYKLSHIVFKSKKLSLLSTLLMCTFLNSYIYLRHALPYDFSMLVFYWMLYVVLKNTSGSRISAKLALGVGACSFFGYLAYPGYFTLYAIILFVFAFNQIRVSGLISKISSTAIFLGGSLLCLLLFEGMSRIGGRSYIHDTLTLSSTITQGSFDESFVFLLKYMLRIESINGILLMLLIGLFYPLLAYKLYRKQLNPDDSIVLLAFAATGLYLAYASAGYFLNKMVFYGRLIHQYLPLMCIFAAYALNELVKGWDKKQLSFGVISTIAVINFGIGFSAFASLVYPRDIGWQLINEYSEVEISSVCEYEYSYSAIPSSEKIETDSLSNSNDLGELLVVNGCYFYPVDDLLKYQPFEPSRAYTLKESYPHFLNFKGYQYEGFTIEERINLDRLNLQVKIYSNM